MTQPADAAANEPKSGHNTSTNTEEQEQPMEVSKPEEEEEEEVTNGPHKSSSGLPYIPITSLPATKDEALKSLILSWYHTVKGRLQLFFLMLITLNRDTIRDTMMD